ncbi:hypothetical protein [Fusibacter sp. 3D3]|uniref:hypothetical protein n=1 Tax=Fusibacter sp. 3D3 TaxID=1048380 RepID=UPI000853EE92|nr:hypothetical protein [Fusibacter sp. 3D3]
MKEKKILKVIPFLILLVAICFIAFSALEDNTTTITIRNNSNKSIKNLIVSSNDSEEYKIESIEPYVAFDFKYNLGRFNENALNMKHIINENSSKNYNILGYIDKQYKNIFIYVDSVDEYYNLSIRVETP